MVEKQKTTKRPREEVQSTLFQHFSATSPPKKQATSAGGSGHISSFESLLREPSWAPILHPLFSANKGKELLKALNSEYTSKKVIFPPKEDIFTAFNSCPLKKVKVVVLGQDPYHDYNQAHGLAFSVRKGIKLPPSLDNIYKELEADIEGFKRPKHGCFEKWAKQGVLLLNDVLTVEAHKAASHSKFGWQQITDGVVKALNSQRKNLVFLLWGAPAQKKGAKIDASKHLILKCPHPSPLSAFRGFFGCKHFSKTNDYLRQNDIKEIDWCLED
eukprot:GCRY01000447.1.p1 GENE.GCRY01000447.1~~GCRY01000447.1.p1  ORF type:complete len:272 (+),score=34.14 GCRY01000447.1:156-971(+)